VLGGGVREEIMYKGYKLIFHFFLIKNKRERERERERERGRKEGRKEEKKKEEKKKKGYGEIDEWRCRLFTR
jgi:hypothetical protein